jgi:hypothetical protein
MDYDNLEYLDPLIIEVYFLVVGVQMAYNLENIVGEIRLL